MREIDLIPASYRIARARAVQLKILAAAVAAVVVATGAARLWLDSGIADMRSRIASLQAQQRLSAAERDQLASLTDKRAGYARQLQMLKGLRSGTAETELFRVIDAALEGDDLWFTNWEFRRAGVTDAEGRAVQTGYFVMVADDGQPEAWQIETHMTISGQAQDHATLSEFVRRLLAQGEIESVRIRRTGVQRFAARNIVDFDLAVILNRRVVE